MNVTAEFDRSIIGFIEIKKSTLFFFDNFISAIIESEEKITDLTIIQLRR